MNESSKIFRLPTYKHGSGEAQEADLGDYIFGSNPYSAVPPPKGIWDKANFPPPPVIYMKEGDKRDQSLYYLDSTGIEVHERPGNWAFKTGEVFVQRALRIPYMYYKEAEYQVGKPDGKLKVVQVLLLVRDYFIVGFEGGAAY